MVRFRSCVFFFLKTCFSPCSKQVWRLGLPQDRGRRKTFLQRATLLAVRCSTVDCGLKSCDHHLVCIYIYIAAYNIYTHILLRYVYMYIYIHMHYNNIYIYIGIIISFYLKPCKSWNKLPRFPSSSATFLPRIGPSAGRSPHRWRGEEQVHLIHLDCQPETMKARNSRIYIFMLVYITIGFFLRFFLMMILVTCI